MPKHGREAQDLPHGGVARSDVDVPPHRDRYTTSVPHGGCPPQRDDFRLRHARMTAAAYGRAQYIFANGPKPRSRVMGWPDTVSRVRGFIALRERARELPRRVD